MRPEQIAALLACPGRTLPGHPDRWMLGPTGRRLWMDYLDPAPGFSGRADFIHKMNLPLLYAVACEAGGPPVFRPEWHVSDSRDVLENDAFVLTERKLITWEDQAVSWQVWENKTDAPLTLTLRLPEGAAPDRPFAFPCAQHGVTPVMLFRSGAPWPDGALTLRPRERRGILLAAAVGLPGEEAALAAGLEPLLGDPDPERLMDRLAADYLRWFDSVPDFECDDRAMTVCWYYRFYLLRKNLAAPGLGRLPGPCFYEGRSHRMDKTPYQASGWEFSRLIPLSTPLQATDARWMTDGAAARDALRALTGCQDESGRFAVTAVDESRKVYAHYAGWALYQFFLLHGDRAFLREALPAFKEDARRVYESARRDDALQVETTHALTGKEYQPSFWYFTDECFPASVRPARAGYTPLKRVDRSVYMYLNFTGLSRLCRLAGDPDEAYFAREAGRLRRDILGKMWDPASRCFYDLHHETDEMAFVKNIVAVYPLWAGITGPEHLPFFHYLLDPRYFALGSGFASCAADCPVFSPDGGWRGDYFKGPHGCMWNGPSWPYATGIALDALAKQSKRCGHAYDAAFWRILGEYTREHFPDGPGGPPCLVEFYHSRTGAPLSEEADYLHSFYVDLIVRHVAGIEPDEDGVTFHPLRTGLKRFSLRGVRVRGHVYDVSYEAEGPRPGYTVRVDGQRRWQGGGGPVRLTNDPL